jgi:DNA-binding beta-propeller fold protein YncE
MKNVIQSSLFVIAIVLNTASVFAVQNDPPKQALELPECDIYLFDVVAEGDLISIANGQNVTKRSGYDNQPWFTPDSKTFLFTANYQSNRTDIYEFDLASGAIQPVTDSPDQEYSPQVSEDNQVLSFVTDGETANQSIWSSNRGGKNLKWVLKNLGEREPVGYYAWNRSTEKVLFWSRYGFSLQLVDLSSNTARFITGDAIPVSPQIVPGTANFSFVHRQGNGEVWIKELNPKTFAVRPLVMIEGVNHHYAWTPNGSILMAQGKKLKHWRAAGKWEDVADFSEYQMQSPTRVAVSPNGKKLAVVAVSGD